MVTMHLTCYRDGVCRVVVEYRDGESYGEEYIDLQPGEGIGQYTYAELRVHGSGEIDINFDAQPVQPAKRLAA